MSSGSADFFLSPILSSSSSSSSDTLFTLFLPAAAGALLVSFPLAVDPFAGIRLSSVLTSGCASSSSSAPSGRMDAPLFSR
eukprot:CAMPEP_0114620562 /NCGR_PEP_ID=MMETSP0168-20121206/8789_1 /TAXON_ID=95228 ORGANISM="Vannella sp., Strain DIVA3 517/6/12" /NCGR_SAMPLE_ID=MMETSP0168 /ASSEMBLY_ACC=CAM_ASM_000044 /LENGTH=80 /DNA_ID=CAMNT_0001831757 /DNA_START=227 /DNA_END=466 /DNA_ORIENTATION=-